MGRLIREAYPVQIYFKQIHNLCSILMKGRYKAAVIIVICQQPLGPLTQALVCHYYERRACCFRIPASTADYDNNPKIGLHPQSIPMYRNEQNTGVSKKKWRLW
jgi:hypothetical protein